MKQKFNLLKLVPFLIILLVSSSFVLALDQAQVTTTIGESNDLIKALISSSISVEELDDIKSFVETADSDNGAVFGSSDLMALWNSKYLELSGDDPTSVVNEGESDSILPWYWWIAAIAILLLIWLWIRIRRKSNENTEKQEKESEKDESKLEHLENELLKLWKIKESLIKKNLEEVRHLTEEEKHKSQVQKEPKRSLSSALSGLRNKDKISDAKDLADLKSRIKKHKVIQGSKNQFSGDQIVTIIDGVLSDFYKIGKKQGMPEAFMALDRLAIKLTQSEGIRGKFVELVHKKYDQN
ncbi:hypothetical protein HN587_04585 [Candidatus Woesearchaeota archaeon]|jgi:hypothetical protein|nr:hypothetical protein [Candidatus Woesearchaeota archaeon]